MTPARRVLLLSGRLGKGHDTLADACAETLADHGAESKTLDAIGLMGSGPGAAGDWVFRRLLSVAPVYDAFHFSQLIPGGRLARASERAALRLLYPALAEAAGRFEPDLLISVFATGAAGAARYRRGHPGVPSIVFITDVDAHRLWVHPETDLFVVTSDVAAVTVRRHLPRANIAVVRAPVRKRFYSAAARSEARAAHGVPADADCVLLVSGSWGLGPIAESARLLADRGIWVLAVAGANKRLERRLQADAQQRPAIVPFGYTDRIAELMAAADVVVTASGDTCREARAVGRRLVVVDVVPGHGRENLMHEIELGGGWIATGSATSVADVTEWALTQGGDPAPEGSATSWEEDFRRILSAVDRRLPA